MSLFYSKTPFEICIPKNANFFNVFEGNNGRSFITSMFVNIPTEREKIVASYNMNRFKPLAQVSGEYGLTGGHQEARLSTPQFSHQ
jgi:hypothetical protein